MSSRAAQTARNLTGAMMLPGYVKRGRQCARFVCASLNAAAIDTASSSDTAWYFFCVTLSAGVRSSPFVRLGMTARTSAPFYPVNRCNFFNLFNPASGGYSRTRSNRNWHQR